LSLLVTVSAMMEVKGRATFPNRPSHPPFQAIMHDIGHWSPPEPWDGNVIEAEEVCKAYARIPVLYPLTFSLSQGSGLALLGPNGSGKSTLLRVLAGATPATGGALRICGYVLPDERRLALRQCIFVGHDSYLYDDLTGPENLRYFATMAGVATSDMVLAEVLDMVGLNPANRDRVRTYSAGMKRRLTLARILLTKPRLLLLDEPHASLDADGQALVDRLVRAALASGRGVIIASHDHQHALDLCDQVLVLDGGRVVFQGAAAAWREQAPIRLVGGARVW
jgi:heme ABC exporter ATP-binding subunit CcmA